MARQNSAYALEDPRPIAKEAPYTFFLPSQQQLDLIGAGDRVYLDFRAIPARTKWESERIWVKVVSVNGEALSGALEHEPDDIPGLHLGDLIGFERWHILQVDHDALAVTGRSIDSTREYWERCLVDQAVLDGALAVEYLYRETPDMGAETDPYPDSGWRIRGDTRGCTDDDIQQRKAAYVALGAVLNRDDSWLHLIDAPAGSAFERDHDTGVFQPAGN